MSGAGAEPRRREDAAGMREDAAGRPVYGGPVPEEGARCRIDYVDEGRGNSMSPA